MLKEIGETLYAEWLFVARSQFFSAYWIVVLLSNIFLIPIFWKEKFRWLKIVGTLLIFYFTHRMLIITVPYTTWELNIDFLFTKQKLLYESSTWIKKLYLAAFYTHIFSAPFVLIAGVSQFSQKLMIDYAHWHRNIGKIYIVIILLFSAPAGFVMSLFANGNAVSVFSFILLSSLWWFFNYKAYRLAQKRDFVTHGNWMLRGYALTLSAVTLRLYMFLIATFKWFSFLSPTEIYVMLSFLSWIPNLIITEILISRGLSKKMMQKRLPLKKV